MLVVLWNLGLRVIALALKLQLRSEAQPARVPFAGHSAMLAWVAFSCVELMDLWCLCLTAGQWLAFLLAMPRIAAAPGLQRLRSLRARLLQDLRPLRVSGLTFPQSEGRVLQGILAFEPLLDPNPPCGVERRWNLCVGDACELPLRALVRRDGLEPGDEAAALRLLLRCSARLWWIEDARPANEEFPSAWLGPEELLAGVSAFIVYFEVDRLGIFLGFFDTAEAWTIGAEACWESDEAELAESEPDPCGADPWVESP